MESPVSRLKTCLSLSLCPQAGAHRDSLSPCLEEPPRWKGGRLAKQRPARALRVSATAGAAPTSARVRRDTTRSQFPMVVSTEAK